MKLVLDHGMMLTLAFSDGFEEPGEKYRTVTIQHRANGTIVIRHKEDWRKEGGSEVLLDTNAKKTEHKATTSVTRKTREYWFAAWLKSYYGSVTISEHEDYRTDLGKEEPIPVYALVGNLRTYVAGFTAEEGKDGQALRDLQRMPDDMVARFLMQYLDSCGIKLRKRFVGNPIWLRRAWYAYFRLSLLIKPET